jgi:hypothetical protein
MKLLIALVLIASAAAVVYVHAQTTPIGNQQYATFGVIGLAPDQTARLNAFGLPVGGPIVAGGSCQVTLSFFDDQGNSLKTATQGVNQGQTVPLELDRGEIDSNATRAEIRGEVRAALTTGNAGSAVPSGCQVVPSLEIYNRASGRTRAFLETTYALPTVIPLALTPAQ